MLLQKLDLSVLPDKIIVDSKNANTQFSDVAVFHMFSYNKQLFVIYFIF